MFANQQYKRRLDKLIDQWVAYRNHVLTRMGASDVSPLEERRFLELKGKIAESLAGVAAGVPVGGNHDLGGHQRSMGDFLNRYTSLQAHDPPGEREREEFEREWHRHFLFLHRLKGLQPPRPSAAQAKLRPVTPAPPMGSRRRGGGGWFLRFAVRVVFLAAVVLVVVAFVPWDRLTGGRRFSSGSLGGAAGDVWSATRDAVGGFQVPTLGGIFQPVVSRYGPELTTIMVGVLLVALGYWIFIRMK